MPKRKRSHRRRRSSRKSYRSSRKYYRSSKRKRQRPSKTKIRGVISTDETLVKLTYYDNFNLSIAAVTDSAYFYRMNSLYDPDITSTGHQPNGYDQWINFYRKYAVYGVKASFHAVSLDQAYGPVSLTFSDTNTQPTSQDECIESKYSQWKHMDIPSWGGKGHHISLRRYMKCEKIAGTQFEEDNDAAAYNANPVRTLSMQLRISNNNVVNTGIVKVYVKLVYYARLFLRVNLTTS